MVVTPFWVRDTVVILLPLETTVVEETEETVKDIGNEKLKLNAAAAGTASPCG